MAAAMNMRPARSGCFGYRPPHGFTRTFSRRGKARPVKLQMVNWWIASGAILCMLISPMFVQAGSQKGDKPMTVSSGTQVSIEYTLRLEDEAVIDTNVGSDPLTYVHGSQQIIPGLEKGLNGMKIGESKRVAVKPDEAYGPVNPEAFKEIEKEKLPPDALKVGAQLEGRDGSGQPVYARVVEVKDRTVVLDLNHPLAGKTLYFEIKVLDIQEKGSVK